MNHIKFHLLQLGWMFFKIKWSEVYQIKLGLDPNFAQRALLTSTKSRQKKITCEGDVWSGGTLLTIVKFMLEHDLLIIRIEILTLGMFV